MKKVTGVLAAVGLLILYSGISYASQMYQRIQVKPVIVQGLVEISSSGKDVQDDDEGNIKKAYDVDVHQVNIKDSPGRFNGVNVVQYVPTRESFNGAQGIDQKFYEVRAVILSKNKGKAFVIFAGTSASYKIILDADNKLVSVEEYQNGQFSKSWKKSFNVALYKTYEIYLEDLGDSGDSRGRLVITEHKFTDGIALGDTKVVSSYLEDMKLDPISDNQLLDFFVGAEASTVSFFDEEIKIFEDV